MLKVLYAVTASYLIGSIPTSYLIGKTKGIDVRKVGSRNVGATNVLRVMGKLPALVTLVVDILKGVIPVTIVARYFFKGDMPLEFNLFKIILGLSAIVGHNWSIFLKFKGGKGVATTCGVLGVLLPVETAIGLIVFLVTVFLTRYVSLGSIFLSLTVPIAAALRGRGLWFIILSVTTCVLISYRHKSNIRRVLLGIENKIGSSKVSSKKIWI